MTVNEESSYTEINLNTSYLSNPRCYDLALMFKIGIFVGKIMDIFLHYGINMIDNIYIFRKEE